MCTRRRSLTDWLTDRQTDRPTNQPTERASDIAFIRVAAATATVAANVAATRTLTRKLVLFHVPTRGEGYTPRSLAFRFLPGPPLTPPYLAPAHPSTRRLVGGPGAPAPARAHASIPLARSLPQWPTQRACILRRRPS